MKNIFKRATALLLSLLMVFSVCSTSLVIYAQDAAEPDVDLSKLLSLLKEEKETINYVALGASNTNGFGLMGYLPDELYGNPIDKMNGSVYGYQSKAELAYPSLVKNTLEDMTGKEVKLDQLAISSMRAEELHVLLDNEYYGDKYTEWRFTAGHNWFNMAHKDGLDGLRKEYQQFVKDADVITVDIGANNFGVYASNRIFNNMFDADFTRFENATQAEIAVVRAEIEKILNTYVSEVLTHELSGMLDRIVDTMTYALVGFCVNFDASMESIYELNPDATVVVVNIQNLMHGLYATLPGMDEPFAFGEFYGAIVDMANIYAASVSPYAEKYSYAYIGENGQAETFLTDIKGYTGNPEDLRTAVSDCFDVYDNDMYLKTRVLQEWLTKYISVVSIVGNKYPVNDLANLNKFGAAVYNEEILVAGTPLKDFLAAGEAGALAQVNPVYQAAYDEYKAMLLTAYDTAATFMQLGANSTVMDLAAAAANFATVGKNVLGTFFTWLLYGMKNPGFDVTQAPALPYYEDATIMCPSYEEVINAPTYMAIITLGVRSDLGNSFFSHPNENGHVEVKNAIVKALSANDKKDILPSEFLAKCTIGEIYCYLYANDYVTLDKTVEIVENAFAAYNATGSFDVLSTVQDVYETILLNKEISDADRIDIIFTVYGILNDAYKLGSTFTTFANIAKKLVLEDESITPLQAFAIVHFVYLAYANDGVIDANEYRVIANLIYYVIFGVPKAKMGRSGFDWSTFKIEDLATMEGGLAELLEKVQEDVAASDEKTATEKIAIINTVYTELKKDETIIQPGSQIEAVGDLFVTLTKEDEKGEALLDPAATEKILSTAFSTLVTPDPENVDANQAITNITQTVVENLVGMEPEKFDKVMEAVKETVGNLGSVGGGDSTIPEIVIPEIPKEVKLANELAYIFQEQGVVNAEQRGKLVATLMPMLLGQTVSRSELVLNTYRIVYNEGFSIDKTVDIVIAVATFAYENRIGAMNYANPYYDKAVAKVLTEDNIAFAQAYVSAAKAKVNEAIVALGGTPKAAIESDTTALKAALLAELEATYDTLVKIEEVLNSNALKNGDEYQIQATIAVLLTFEEDLNKHSANINAIATEAGALAMPYIVQAIGAINQYTQIAANVAVAAYEWCVENVQNFKADYIALAKQLSGYAAEIDPAFGTAVYNFMINTPADAMRTIYLYGEGAVDVLIDRSLDYADGVAAAAIELARVIKKYGAKVYSAIRNDATCYGLYAELRGIYAEILALRAQIGLSGIAIDVYRRLDEVTAYGIDVADKFYHAAIQAVKDEDFQAGVELKDAIDGLVTALAAIDNESIDYAEWLVTHAGAMCGAVLAGLIENWNEFAEVSGPIVYKKAIEIYNAVKEYVLNYDYESLIQQVIDAAIKLAPELDAMLYDYFYNNPEEVIAFFNEYGDVIVDLCKKYGTPVLAVIGVALAVSGPELAEYIINNPQEVIAGLTAWADKYGAKVVAILQVYAEALGLCDAVRGEVAELNNKLAALQAELMNQLNILQNELQVELDALYAQLENATEAAKVIILEKIKENESKIELVQKYIAELQAKIAELQVKIAEINAKLQALIDALYNLDDALKALLETGTESGVAAVQKALNEVANAVRDVIGVISGDIAAQIDKLLQKVEDYLNDAYHSAIIADYVINSNSSYVALGDNEEYAKLFAQYLKDTVAVANVGYNYNVNTTLVQNGSKITTLPVIINENLSIIATADLISIGYSFDKVAEDTILMAVELLMDGKTSVPTDYDWATIAGAEAAAEIEKLVGEIYTYMLNEGLGITVSEATSGMFDHNVTIADIAIIAVQYFVYNVVEYAAYLPQAVNAISQINPDAIIMINSISNPISGAKVSFFGEEIVFGDYLDYVCDAMFVETAVLAAIYENVVFVPTTEIETTFTNRTISFNSSKDFIALAELLTALMENQAINTTPNGNAYACQKMTEALNITVEDGGLLGDVNGDGVVDYIDAILILRYEVGFVDPKFIAGVADVDRDGYIGYVDAIWVLKYEAGLEKEFPASK